MAAAAGLWQALARLAPRLPGGDGDLLARFADSRDGPAFHELMRRHGKLVWAACRRQLTDFADAEDAFQATWLVLAAKPRAVRRGESLPSWLHGTAWKVSTRLRQQRRRLRPPVEVAAPEASDGREALAALDEELARLPAKLRGPLTAYYLQELTQDEAASALGLSVSTVKRRLAAGRDLLKARLTRRGVELGAALALLTLPARDAPATLAELTLLAATTGTLPAALSPLVHGVIVMMWHAKLKSAAVGLGMIALTTAGVGTLATTGHGQGPGGEGGGPPAAAKAAEPPAKVEPAMADSSKRVQILPQEADKIEDLEFDIARAKLQIERADIVIEGRKFAQQRLDAAVMSPVEFSKIAAEAVQAQEDKLVAERALKSAQEQLAALKGEPKPPAVKPATDAIRKLQEKRLAEAKSDYEYQQMVFKASAQAVAKDKSQFAVSVACAGFIVSASTHIAEVEEALAETQAETVAAWKGQQTRLATVRDLLLKEWGVGKEDFMVKHFVRDAELVAEIRLVELGAE